MPVGKLNANDALFESVFEEIHEVSLTMITKEKVQQYQNKKGEKGNVHGRGHRCFKGSVSLMSIWLGTYTPGYAAYCLHAHAARSLTTETENKINQSINARKETHANRAKTFYPCDTLGEY